MKVISLINQKGGVGKTTLGLSLAARWHLSGKSVAIIDADPQKSAVFWKGQQSPDSRLLGIDVYAASLPSEIRSSRDLKVDYLIVDTPGTDQMMTRSAVNISDAILIPVQPSSFDVRASAPSVQAALATGKPTAYVVNRFVHQSQLGREVMTSLRKTPARLILKAMGQYQAFSRSAGEGETPTTMFPDTAASQNVEAVGQAIDEWLQEHQI